MEVDITDSGRDFLEKLLEEDFDDKAPWKGLYILSVLKREGPKEVEDLLLEINRSFRDRDHRPIIRDLFEAGYIEQV